MNKNQPILMQKWRAILPSLLLCISAAFAQENNSAIPALRATERPTSKVGLPVGDRIPDFHAVDQSGAARDFESIRGPKGAVLYFYRSADWCIYCQAQLVETEASRQALLKNGFGLAGVSYDSPEILKKFADAKGIHYTLLSDPESKLIRDFQVLDATVLPNTPGYGVPYHGFYVIDENGIVLSKLFDTETTVAHSAGVVVSHLFGSPANTLEKIVKLNHLTLTYYASANSIAPGDEIELFIDVKLDDNIHVYAPNAKSFTPVDWQIVSQPGVTALPVTFPTATPQISIATVTKDPAPVYTGSFRLSRRVTISAHGPANLDSQGNVSIKGSLKFQACDDAKQVCYSPATVPLEWKLGQTSTNRHVTSE